MHILVTGGAGYIGSHTVVELLHEGHKVTVLDNFSNSSPKVIERLEKICGTEVPCYNCDIRDRSALDKIFSENDFDCCMHFAALKSVNASIAHATEYYDNNVSGSLLLLQVMAEHGCRNLVFSSSACVYGNAEVFPVTEDMPRPSCTNPYGRTKSMTEDILCDIYRSGKANDAAKPWNIVILRYFNPLGAHSSGLIGEDPAGIPDNLMPYITQVAVGKLDHLNIFGDDYDTPDGTGVRDYIHVSDLAKGHTAALKAIEKNCGLAVYNLGTGKGCSVLELVNTFEKVNGIKIPYVIKGRRAGDCAVSYADVSKAYRELGWKAELTTEDMCRDSWNWQKNNPSGYKE